MLIELIEGFYCDPEQVAVVKVTGKDECVLFTTGQSAVDGGFKLDCNAVDAVDGINEALDNPEGEDDEEEE